jgi:hypothetical protein
MLLQINTNGAWRTVMGGLGQHDEATLTAAKAAAAELARIGAQVQRKPHSWRLVSESTETMLEVCKGDAGWQQWRQAGGAT